MFENSQNADKGQVASLFNCLFHVFVFFFQTPLVFTPLSAELALQLGRMANFELLFYVIRLNKPISQSCTVAKSENSGRPLNNQNLADRMED